MEVVTHLANDTVEFYKWSLTIAGELSSLVFKPLKSAVTTPKKIVFNTSNGSK